MWLLVAALLMGGCATSQEAVLIDTSDAFTAAMQTATVAVEAGLLTADEARKVIGIAEAGDKLLDEWDALVREGKPVSAYVDSVRFLIRQLIAIRMASERRANDG